MEIDERYKRLFTELIKEIQVTSNRELIRAIKALKEWTPEFKSECFDISNPFYKVGDENSPFFSESFLYTLLGKGDARTLLSLMKPIWKLIGE